MSDHLQAIAHHRSPTLRKNPQFNQQKRYRVSDFSKVTTIISDFPEPTDWKRALAEHEVEWRFAP